MRQAFFKEVTRLAGKDKDIYILTGDLGFGLFDEFRAHYPERFINAGIAESNMIGVAAGLALRGKKVFCYSIAPFLVMRAYESIRMDIASQNIPVRLIGSGGGFTYGFEGYSHFGLEDYSLMRSLPNMRVISPADAVEAKLLARKAVHCQYPLYIRIGKKGSPDVHRSDPDFRIGKGIVLSLGEDAVIFATGEIVYIAKLAVGRLKSAGISVTLVDLHTLKPLDAKLVKEYALSHPAVFTVEEHFLTGGLGSAVAEVLAEGGYGGIFRRLGIRENYLGIVGDAEHLRREHCLSAKAICNTILREIRHKPEKTGEQHGLEGQVCKLP